MRRLLVATAVVAPVIVVLAALLTSASLAQPAAISQEAINGFVKSYAAPTPALGKMAKWMHGICPITAGLKPAFNLAVTARVRDIAAMVGAPVGADADTSEPCKPNIDIVFARQPQALLDDIRKRQPVYLGYHDVAQAQRIATASYPIQAWYATQTEDQKGKRQVDTPQENGDVWIGGEYFGYTKVSNSQMGRLGDGLRSDFYHIVIVADLNKVAGMGIGPLADDIAVLVLSQPQTFDSCLTPPSITNLMSPGCEARPKEITEIDMAYLRALYRTDTTSTFMRQTSDIADEMQKGLGGN